jgi:DNA repair exonuclease SbcCD ATPase subunit
MKGLLTAALAALATLPLTAQPAQADDAAAHAPLARMLEAGWGTNTSFRTAGNQQADAAFAAAGRSPQVLYAVAVMYIKQGRYAEAQKSIDELLAREASHLPGKRAKVWLSVILKDYGVALVAAEKLAADLPSGDAEKEKEEAHRETLAFLGRIYGFLGGPAAANVKIEERKASERKILARLTTEHRALFEEARDGVLQKHLELIDAKEATTDAAKEAAEDAKAKTLDEIAKEREDRAARLKELQERRDKLQSELRDELAQIAKEDRPLLNELAGLERRARTINRELLRIQGQISGLQGFLDREQDPNKRQFWLDEIDRLVNVGSRIDANLAQLNRLAAGVQSQRQTLAARQQKAQADIGGQIKRINDEANELARREKRAAGMERRAERATTSTPAAALALRATAGALATYDPFPLEQERARILETLK